MTPSSCSVRAREAGHSVFFSEQLGGFYVFLD